jgi:hypothetical protein
MNYDIISDIHGRYDKISQLMARLGYVLAIVEHILLTTHAEAERQHHVEIVVCHFIWLAVGGSCSAFPNN